MKKLLLTSAILFGMAVPAQAQHVSFGFGKHTRNSSVHVGVQLGKRPHVHVDYQRRDRRGARRYHRTRRHHDHGRRVYRNRRVVRPHYRIVTERVWVPGCSRRVYVPARWGYRYDDCGHRVRYCIQEAHYHIVRDPGRWEYRRRRVRC